MAYLKSALCCEIVPTPTSVRAGYAPPPPDRYMVGDILCYELARDGTLISLVRRNGAIILAEATDIMDY